MKKFKNIDDFLDNITWCDRCKHLVHRDGLQSYVSPLSVGQKYLCITCYEAEKKSDNEYMLSWRD